MNLKSLFEISWRKVIFTLGFFIVFFLISIQYRYFSWIKYDKVLIWDQRPGVIASGMSENAAGVDIVKLLCTLVFSYLLAIALDYTITRFNRVEK